MDFNLNTKLEQNLILSQSLRYAIELLTMSSYDLEKEIESESEGNIFIDMMPRKSSIVRSDCDSYDNFDFINSLKDSKEDYRKELLEEVKLIKLNDLDYKISEYIIYSLDEKGFLRTPVEEISNIFQTSTELIEKNIEIIKKLGLGGLSSKNIKDFFIFQASNDNLKDFISKYFDKIIYCKFFSILRDCPNREDEFKIYLNEIKNFRLYPLQGLLKNNNEATNVEVDIVAVVGDSIRVKINDPVAFRINDFYRNMIDTAPAQTKTYLKRQLSRANFLKNSISQRNRNILSVSKAIIDYQKPFILGEKPLKILTMKLIAQKTDLSISTVSRVVNNKNLMCNSKIYSLKSFFSSGIKTPYGEFSADQIKTIIISKIEAEDKTHPISDDSLCELLNREGIPVKRRTISKYRNKLGILNTRERKYISTFKFFLNT